MFHPHLRRRQLRMAHLPDGMILFQHDKRITQRKIFANHMAARVIGAVEETLWPHDPNDFSQISHVRRRGLIGGLIAEEAGGEVRGAVVAARGSAFAAAAGARGRLQPASAVGLAALEAFVAEQGGGAGGRGKGSSKRPPSLSGAVSDFL